MGSYIKSTMRRSWPGTGNFLTCTLMLIVVVVACGACSEQPPDADMGDTRGSRSPRVLVSLPDFRLRDHSGAAVDLDTFAGKVWVANFIFTRCPSTCPMQTSEMKALQAKLAGLSEWDDIRLVSFTVDPEFDTPDVLAQYAQRHGADATHWKFVTGTREALWDLSKDGFKLDVGDAAKTEVMPIYHSPRVVLVDRSGRVRGYYDGLTDEGMTALQKDLATVLAEPYAAETNGDNEDAS